MTTTEQALKKATNMTFKEFAECTEKGGWDLKGMSVKHWALFPFEMLLSPDAWRACGKVKGWNKNKTFDENDRLITWRTQHHHFIDCLHELDINK